MTYSSRSDHPLILGFRPSFNRHQTLDCVRLSRAKFVSPPAQPV